jgi:twitching motility protein PilI
MTTNGGGDTSLRSLRDRPFELLKELEKRSRTVATANAPEASAGPEWVGVACRMGGETFLIAREETREVLGYPAVITRIPGAKSWVRGLANVRGSLLPMVDLRQFLGSGTTAAGRNTRVVVVNHREIPAGLVVDEVLGFRRFAESEFNAEAPPTVIRCEAYLAGAFRRGGEVWPVLSLKTLVESQSFLQAAS